MADTQSPAQTEPGVRGRPRIDFATRLAVLRLVAESPHLSNVAIGQMLNLSDQSVMRLRSMVVGDVKSLTQSVLQTEIAPAIEDWVTARTLAADRGDHRPARDMLLAAGAIEDTTKAAALNVGFQVLIAPSPGTPAYTQVNELPASVVTRAAAASVPELACATASAPPPDAVTHNRPSTHPPNANVLSTHRPDVLSTPPPLCAAPSASDGTTRVRSRSRVRR